MRMEELQQALHKVNPAAVLVSPQVLEKVIQQLYQLPTIPWDVPHRKTFVVNRQDLFRHIEQDDLNLNPDYLLPQTVILLVRPSHEQLAGEKVETLLSVYWRRLFHASIHLLLEQRYKNGALPLEVVRQRIEEIGQTEFDEVRRVLIEERFLLPSADEPAVYIEFAAVFLELRYFGSSLVPIYFPALGDPAPIEQILARDFDPRKLYQETRLPGAADPVMLTDNSSDESHDFYWKLVHGAERAEKAGNLVRSAILRTKAARVAPANLTRSTRAEAERDMHQLATRLAVALELSKSDVVEWAKDLNSLLDKADQDNRPVEADLLFELQKVCLDAEQGVYALSLVDWMLSLGRRPIKRELPYEQLVRIIKHLRSARQRLTMARLSDLDRQHLGQLLDLALNKSEVRLRAKFRPALDTALRDVGLKPANPPEQVAFAKIIEELLDRIIALGYLTFSDLRDVISRNQLKLPDLLDPQDFLRGDPLLRLDHRLGSLLDGVYRPSELYSRMLERVTALSFGTRTGRLITTFAIIPFGGAFVLIEAIHQMILKHLGIWAPKPLEAPLLITSAMGQAGGLPHLWQAGWATELFVKVDQDIPAQVFYPVLLLLGLFFMGLWHSPRVRGVSSWLLLGIWETFRLVFVVLPVRVARMTWVKWLVGSWPFQFFYWCLLKPMLFCIPLWLLRPDWFSTWIARTLCFLTAVFAVNSAFGQAMTETFGQVLLRLSELISVRLFKGLVNLTMYLFKEAVSTLEGVLFTIDEWLRFRTGESRTWTAFRLIGGLIWFPISWFLRFYIVVLVEPGFNPIKFPITSVAAKFVYPLSPMMYAWLTPQLQATGPVVYPILFAFVSITWFFLPDVFAYFIWEVKENWGLYQANRAEVIKPAPIGPHGETLLTLLEPGIHSGTIPRLFARWRRAERDAIKTGNWRVARTYRQALADLQRTLKLFVERNLVAMVHQSRLWLRHELSVGRVVLSRSRIRIELKHARFPDRPVWLGFEEHAGWLVAEVADTGFLTELPPAELQPLNTALVSLYKLAAVGLVREQLRAQLPARFHAYDIEDKRLILWLDQRHGQAIQYSWQARRGQLQPQPIDGQKAGVGPVLKAVEAVFRRVPLAWQQWVDCWEKDQDGAEHPHLVSHGVDLDLIALARAHPTPPFHPPAGPLLANSLALDRT